MSLQTNSTLLIMLIYGGTYTKFRDFNDGDNNCKPAFNYLWVYLALNLLAAFTVLVTVSIGAFAERVRYVSRRKKIYEVENVLST